MKRSLGRKFVFVVGVAFLLFNFPLVKLFDQVPASSFPRSYLLFFLFWSILVLTLFLVVRKPLSSSAAHE